MDRKEYVKPGIDIIEFDSQNDIITSSTGPKCGGTYEYYNEEIGFWDIGRYPSEMTM